MRAPASWMIGAAVRIDIPGRGSYVPAAYDPNGSAPHRIFRAIAHADGKRLNWALGGDRVEITSSTNILKEGGKGTLGVSRYSAGGAEIAGGGYSGMVASQNVEE